MTELTFLMELFLEDEMPKEIKKRIVGRIKEVELQIGSGPQLYNRPTRNDLAPQGFPEQAPSMQRLMQQNPDIIPKPPVPATPAAAAALQARQAMIDERMADPAKKPRKA